jgi:hypothetical protein
MLRNDTDNDDNEEEAENTKEHEPAEYTASLPLIRNQNVTVKSMDVNSFSYPRAFSSIYKKLTFELSDIHCLILIVLKFHSGTCSFPKWRRLPHNGYKWPFYRNKLCKYSQDNIMISPSVPNFTNCIPEHPQAASVVA